MKVSASILAVDDREGWIKKLNNTDIDYLHVDVMDGEFVDNKQFGIREIEEVNRISSKLLDVHLMVARPVEYLEKLRNMNISFITFHYEVDGDKREIIEKIRELGYKVGISIKPKTPVSLIKDYLKMVDMVLIMSVEPGRGGQKFLEGSLEKVRELKELIQTGNYDTLIERDGGVNVQNIEEIKKSLVDISVIGSYIVGREDYVKRIKLIKED